MLQNAYFLAKIGADTAENEQHFAEILPKNRRDIDLRAARRAAHRVRRRRTHGPPGPHGGRARPGRVRRGARSAVCRRLLILLT